MQWIQRIEMLLMSDVALAKWAWINYEQHSGTWNIDTIQSCPHVWYGRTKTSNKCAQMWKKANIRNEDWAISDYGRPLNTLSYSNTGHRTNSILSTTIAGIGCWEKEYIYAQVLISLSSKRPTVLESCCSKTCEGQVAISNNRIGRHKLPRDWYEPKHTDLHSQHVPFLSWLEWEKQALHDIWDSLEHVSDPCIGKILQWTWVTAVSSDCRSQAFSTSESKWVFYHPQWLWCSDVKSSLMFMLWSLMCAPCNSKGFSLNRHRMQA